VLINIPQTIKVFHRGLPRRPASYYLDILVLPTSANTFKAIEVLHGSHVGWQEQ